MSDDVTSIIQALKNSGIDIECGACMEIAFTGVTTNEHTCDVKNEMIVTVERCCTGNDPTCPTHGIAASNARQNEYWKRVGGHPDAGEADGE